MANSSENLFSGAGRRDRDDADKAAAKLPASVRLLPRFIDPAAADNLCSDLRRAVDWRRDSIRLFGREHLIPRLHQWYADSGVSYSWSGITMQPLPWLPELKELRDRVSNECGLLLNSVLVNLYRDGHDSMGWHSDDEPELGDEPLIASLSLGATRDFQLRRKDRAGKTITLPLCSGSLLLMGGRSQHEWQHALPKRTRVTGARINLTFRRIISP